MQVNSLHISLWICMMLMICSNSIDQKDATQTLHTCLCCKLLCWISLFILALPRQKIVISWISCLLQFSKYLKVAQSLWKCLSVKLLWSGWDAELLSVSSRSKLFAYGYINVSGRLRVNHFYFFSNTCFSSVIF